MKSWIEVKGAVALTALSIAAVGLITFLVLLGPPAVHINHGGVAFLRALMLN